VSGILAKSQTTTEKTAGAGFVLSQSFREIMVVPLPEPGNDVA
jgi:hypothetical protein